MQQSVLSIDVGTTGCKVVAFSKDGKDICSAYSEYKTIVAPGGISELNPTVVWTEVSKCIMAVSSQNIDIKAISVSSLGEAAVLLDVDNNVLGNAILYNDFRGAEELSAILDDDLKNYIPKVTGQPVSYLHTLWKLIWISKHNKELYKKIEHVLFFADYIVYMLTNSYTTDYSLASRSMMFNIDTLTWDDRLVALTGLSTNKLPKTVQSGTIIGKITEEAAIKLGINPEAKIVAGGHDQPCGVLGCVAARPGDIVSASGTIEAINATIVDIKTANRLIELGYSIEPSTVTGKYMAMAISLTGGSLLKWFRSVFTDDNTDIGEYRNIYAFLDSKLSSEPAKSLVIPYLSGTGTPDYDTKYCGQIFNLRQDVSREDIYKACMEGLCFEMDKTLQILKEAGIAINSACTIGGGAYSDLWSQIKSDIWNIDVYTVCQRESVALGLASLSAYALGWFPSPEMAAENFIEYNTIFHPNRNNNKIYLEKNEKFKKLSNLCRNLEN